MNISLAQFCAFSLQNFILIKENKLKSPELSFLKHVVHNYEISEAQLFQDLFVTFLLNKKNGTFVDFGATNGKTINNSYMLEKYYDWTGVVCEPNPTYHEELKRNRTCFVETKCVSNASDKVVTFLKTNNPELSTMVGYDNDEHDRSFHDKIEVQTISLNDLLKRHGIEKVDYLSVDTEGSEYDILSVFDIEKHLPTIITVEHNYTENRHKIHTLLTSKGYVRKFEMFSRWDDWYILNDLKINNG